MNYNLKTNIVSFKDVTLICVESDYFENPKDLIFAVKQGNKYIQLTPINEHNDLIKFVTKEPITNLYEATKNRIDKVAKLKESSSLYQDTISIETYDKLSDDTKAKYEVIKGKEVLNYKKVLDDDKIQYSKVPVHYNKHKDSKFSNSLFYSDKKKIFKNPDSNDNSRAMELYNNLNLDLFLPTKVDIEELGSKIDSVIKKFNLDDVITSQIPKSYEYRSWERTFMVTYFNKAYNDEWTRKEIYKSNGRSYATPRYRNIRKLPNQLDVNKVTLNDFDFSGRNRFECEEKITQFVNVFCSERKEEILHELSL